MTASTAVTTPGVSRRAVWALALAATLTMAVSYVDRQTLSVLAPTVTRALGISDHEYGWLASAFSIAYLVGAPLAGRLIDAVGARRGLLGAVLVWSIVAGLHALAPAFGVLFALRIALGLAEAPSFPGAAQTVHRVLPPESRARGFGILFTGSSFGAMVAPPLATAIEARFGWRLAFVVTAVVGLCWIPIWLTLAFSERGRRLLDEEASQGHSKAAPIDWRSWLALWLHPAVLRAVAVVVASAPAISFMLLWGAKYLVKDHGLTQKQVGSLLWIPPLMFDLGAVLFGHFASQRGSRPNHDGSPPRLLFVLALTLSLAIGAMPYAPSPTSAMITGGFAMAGGGGLFALLTSDMLARVPKSVVSSAGGITAAAQSLAYIVANPLIGRSVERHGTYTPVLLQLALFIAPFSLLWLVWRPPPLTERDSSSSVTI